MVLGDRVGRVGALRSQGVGGTAMSGLRYDSGTIANDSARGMAY